MVGRSLSPGRTLGRRTREADSRSGLAERILPFVHGRCRARSLVICQNSHTDRPTDKQNFVRGCQETFFLVHSIAVITYSKSASHAYRTSASEPLARAGCGAEAAHNGAGSCFAQGAMHVYLEHRQRSPSRARDFQVIHSFSKVLFE